MRFTVTAVVVAAALVCISISASGKSNSILKTEKKEARIQKQLKRLRRMLCEPVLRKIYVKTLLSEFNTLHDKRLLTNVVAIRRCDDSIGFCGRNFTGTETQSCEKTKWKFKKFQVIYFGDNGKRRYAHFKAEEHEKCGCNASVIEGAEGLPMDTSEFT